MSGKEADHGEAMDLVREMGDSDHAQGESVDDLVQSLRDEGKASKGSFAKPGSDKGASNSLGILSVFLLCLTLGNNFYSDWNQRQLYKQLHDEVMSSQKVIKNHLITKWVEVTDTYGMVAKVSSELKASASTAPDVERQLLSISQSLEAISSQHNEQREQYVSLQEQLKKLPRADSSRKIMDKIDDLSAALDLLRNEVESTQTRRVPSEQADGYRYKFNRNGG